MTEGKERGYYFRSAEMSTTTTNYILPLLTSSISFTVFPCPTAPPVGIRNYF